jgi:hypothetical protein
MEDGDRTGAFFSNPFSPSWYYQPRLKGLGAGADVPPLVPVGNTNLD